MHLRVHCVVLNQQPTPTPLHQTWWRGSCRGPGLTGSQCYGGHGERETPGLIPNPEAKPLSADGTALETGWESRTPPDNHSRKGPSQPAGALSAFPDGFRRQWDARGDGSPGDGLMITGGGYLHVPGTEPAVLCVHRRALVGLVRRLIGAEAHVPVGAEQLDGAELAGEFLEQSGQRPAYAGLVLRLVRRPVRPAVVRFQP